MTAAFDEVVRMEAVTVRFKATVALDRVTIALGKGRIVGLIGPNGAGKTTLMRVLATLLIPTSGTVRVFGTDAVRDPQKTRTRIGYLPDASGLYQDMRVAEYLEFFASAHGLGPEARRNFIATSLKTSGLAKRADDFVETLSLGMRAKLSFAKTLAGNPGLLILDEPLSGLDPMALSDMLGLLNALKAEGKTIFISSHLLSNLDKICDEVIFLYQGRVAEERVDEPGLRYLLRVREPAGGATRIISGMPSVVAQQVKSAAEGCLLELRLSADADPAEVLGALIATGLHILEWRLLSEGLDERLMRLARQEEP